MVSFTINFEVMSTTHYFKVNCKTNHLAIVDIIDIVPYCRVGLMKWNAKKGHNPSKN